jgi:O-antigen ligase
MGMSTVQTFEYGVADPRWSFAQSMSRICVTTLVCVALLAPPITLDSALPWVKAEQILLPLIFVFYAWLLLAGYARLIRFNFMFLIGIAYSLSVLLSIAYGSGILGQPVIFRDFYELPKLWFPIIFFTLGFEAELSEISLRRLLHFFALAIMPVCFYAWIQWAGAGFSFTLNHYYSGGLHIDVGLQHYRRVFATMGNPNVLGQLMTWSIVALTMAALYRVGNRIKNIAVAFACLITLAMTGSRYGLITTSIGIALIFLLPSPSYKKRITQIGLLLLLLPAIGWTVATVANSNRSTLQRIESLKNPLQADSLRKRLDYLWRDAGNDIAQSPLLGHGPAKTIFTGVFTDSEYLDVLKEFGVLGFFSYICYFLFPLHLSWKGLLAGQRAGPQAEEHFPATFLVLRLSCVMAVTALVMNIGESTFYNQILQGFLWLWLGLGARCAKAIEAI